MKGHFRRGEAYVALGEYARAERALLRATELEPGNKTVAAVLKDARERGERAAREERLGKGRAAAEAQPSFGGRAAPPASRAEAAVRAAGAGSGGGGKAEQPTSAGASSRAAAAAASDGTAPPIDEDDEIAAAEARRTLAAPGAAIDDISGADADVSQTLWPLDREKLASGHFKRCKQCNTVLHVTLTVCPGCSFAFKQRCKECTAVVPSVLKQCSNCGSNLPKLRAAAPEPQPQRQQEQAARPGGRRRAHPSQSQQALQQSLAKEYYAPAGPPEGYGEAPDTDSDEGEVGTGAPDGETPAGAGEGDPSARAASAFGQKRTMRGWDASLIPHYVALEVPRGAGEAAVRRAYRSLVIENHPLLGGEAQDLSALCSAYDAIAADAAAHETAGLPPPPPGAIFVTIACYRDSEARWTIVDAHAKAADPSRLFFGVVWQTARDEREQYPGEGGHSGAGCLPTVLQQAGRVRELRLSHRDAEGAAYARSLGARLWNGEDFVLMVDAHTRFAAGWDERARAMLACAGEQSAKPILTTQPIGYRLRDEVERTAARDVLDAAIEEATAALQERVDDHTACLDAADVEHLRRGCVWAAPTGEVELPAAPLPTVPCAVRCRRDGLPHLAPRALAEAPAAPVPTLFWAPQFSFSRAEALMVEAPFCAHLPHLARGDEMLMSCRLWAAGWDFFAPNETLAYHLWDAEYRPSLEREAFMAEDGEHREQAMALQGASAGVVAEVLRGLGKGGDAAAAAAAEACGAAVMTRGDRGVAAFQEHCGVNIATRKLAPHARTGGQSQHSLSLQRQVGFLPA